MLGDLYAALVQHVPEYHLIALMPVVIAVLASLADSFVILCSSLISPQHAENQQMPERLLSEEELSRLFDAWQKRLKKR